MNQQSVTGVGKVFQVQKATREHTQSETRPTVLTRSQLQGGTHGVLAQSNR